MKKLAVVIGRFQPLHNGHIELLKQAEANSDHLLVLIGSSGESRSPKNPFTFDERSKLIAPHFPKAYFRPLYDFTYNDDVWQKQVAKIITNLQQAYLGPCEVTVFGHHKDDSSYYLDTFGYGYHEVKQVGEPPVNACDIRHDWLDGWIANNTDIPYNVKKFMWGEVIEDYYEKLQYEYEETNKYIDSWKDAPFKPVFIATDGIIYDQARTGLWLITRKSEFGNGKYALPGGFLESNEYIMASTYREIYEEMQIPKEKLSFIETKVFDKPDRSARGRMVTHVSSFLAADTVVPVAGDDAATVEFKTFAEIRDMRSKFFADHWHIIYNMVDGVRNA